MNTIKELENEIKSLNSRIAELEGENLDLEDSISRYDRDESDYQDTIEELREEIARLNGREVSLSSGKDFFAKWGLNEIQSEPIILAILQAIKHGNIPELINKITS